LAEALGEFKFLRAQTTAFLEQLRRQARIADVLQPVEIAEKLDLPQL
jgi:hypothetical protein